MTRMSKKGKRRHLYPRKRQSPFAKTGPKEDNLPSGFKQHENALEGNLSSSAFIPKIK